ncbi:apolipoprotein N-acyltransferase, partial [Streptomyces sp. NPDC054956]
MSSSATRAAGNEPPKPVSRAEAEAEPVNGSPRPPAGAPAVSPVRRWAERLARPGLAVLSGVLLYLSFPPRPLWWLAPLALALLGFCLYGRRARAGFGLGVLH